MVGDLLGRGRGEMAISRISLGSPKKQRTVPWQYVTTHRESFLFRRYKGNAGR